MKEKKVQYVPLSQVHPDPDQPRKSFDAERLSDLASSIKQHGIINPLIVEPDGKGFILVDGERRYRAAKIAKLVEVPVVVVDSNSPVDRLIQQFHLQEQHQGWTATEKAVAVLKLAQQLKIGVPELSRQLSIPKRTISDYVAFSQLIEQKEFHKNEVPVNYAGKIVRLKTFVKNELMKREDTEFTQKDESNLELAIIERVKEGTIKRDTDLIRIRDSVKTDPTSIFKFMKDDKMTSDKLFIQTKARAAYEARNVLNMCSFLNGHLPTAAREDSYKLVEVDSREHNVIKKAIKLLTSYEKMIK